MFTSSLLWWRRLALWPSSGLHLMSLVRCASAWPEVCQDASPSLAAIPKLRILLPQQLAQVPRQRLGWEAIQINKCLMTHNCIPVHQHLLQVRCHRQQCTAAWNSKCNKEWITNHHRLCHQQEENKHHLQQHQEVKHNNLQGGKLEVLNLVSWGDEGVLIIRKSTTPTKALWRPNNPYQTVRIFICFLSKHLFISKQFVDSFNQPLLSIYWKNI